MSLSPILSAANSEEAVPGKLLLALDVGNTNIKGGLFQGRHLLGSFRLETASAVTGSEFSLASGAALGAQLIAQCERLRLAPSAVRACALASVVPSLTPSLVAAVSAAFDAQTLLLLSGVNVPIKNHYDVPAQAGVDRLLNALAAFHRFKAAVVIVDCGTATKVDCVSPEGAFLGGAIAPGLDLCLRALTEKAANLSEVELLPPPKVVATNTKHALQAGVLLGHAAMIDGLVQRVQTELGFTTPVLATGGSAARVVPHCACITSVLPNLTLQGIQLAFEHAQPAG